jgi:hypothetical protein
MLGIVHPSLLTHLVGEPSQHIRRQTVREHSVRELSSALPYVVGRSLRRRAAKLLRRL